MMDNLVTFVAVAAPLAVWMIALAVAGYLTENKKYRCQGLVVGIAVGLLLMWLTRRL